MSFRATALLCIVICFLDEKPQTSTAEAIQVTQDFLFPTKIVCANDCKNIDLRIIFLIILMQPISHVTLF